MGTLFIRVKIYESIKINNSLIGRTISDQIIQNAKQLIGDL